MTLETAIISQLSDPKLLLSFAQTEARERLTELFEEVIPFELMSFSELVEAESISNQLKAGNLPEALDTDEIEHYTNYFRAIGKRAETINLLLENVSESVQALKSFCKRKGA